jgi:hypothetical protein
MQVTIRQLIDSWGALQKLATIDAGPASGITIKQAFAIGKIAKIVEPELQRVESLKMKLFETQGEPILNENGDPAKDGSGQPLMKIKNEYQSQFIEQMEEMFDTMVDISIEPWSIDSLSNEVPLSAVDLTRLSWLIVGD